MLDRFFNFIEQVADKLVGKGEEPEVLLGHNYQDLQLEMMQLERMINKSLASEENLKEALLRSEGQDAEILRTQLKHHEAVTNSLRNNQDQVLRALANWHSRIGSLLEYDGSANAKMDSSLEIVEVTSAEEERRSQQLQKEALNSADIARQKQATKKPTTMLFFASLWLVFNCSFFYLLCRFSHLPTQTVQIIGLTTFFSLSWIWWREYNWLSYNADLLWQEMTKDLNLWQLKRRR